MKPARRAKEIGTRYDAVVIGAGIGGLTCANYLAKAGASILLVERHHVPGGYCSSFKKGKYYFDAGAHYLGSCRPEGQIGRLLSDHKLESKVTLLRCSPSEVVVTKHHEVLIHDDIEKTTHGISEEFPKEADSVRNFIKYVAETDPLKLYIELKDRTFGELLDQYFHDWEIKAVFATLLGNIGLPSSRASALTSAFLYREFIFDGGYYPKGGMQAFPDALLENFEEYGGDSAFLTPAERIVIGPTGSVQSISVRVRGKEEREITTRAIIANCDPYQLYGRLLGREGASISEAQGIRHRLPTVSAFMLHLGVKHDIAKEAKYHCNIWSYRKHHVDEYYSGVMDGQVEYGTDSFLFCSIPTFHDPQLLPEGLHSIQAIVAAPFLAKDKWDEHKGPLAEDVMNRLEQFIPGLRGWVEVEYVATPHTLVKYTANHCGAMYGWASIPTQVASKRLPDETPIDGLFTVGHWTGLPSGHSGVPSVVTSGRNVARLVLRWLRKGGVPVHQKAGNGKL